MASLNPWHQLLLRSLEANKGSKTLHFVSLATVRPNGQPANRTVVFRGFQAGTSKLQFNTDSRTKKIEEIQLSPWAEVCWYFVETWEQYRILGRMEIIGPDTRDPTLAQERVSAWKTSSPRIQAWFVGPPPGQPCQPDGDVKGSPEPTPAPLEPPETFCLLNLNPLEVDYLNLQKNSRSTYTQAAGDGANVWRKEDVNP